MGMAGLIFEPHPPNLKINTSFEDVQMMLKLFFDFSIGFRFSKISVECSVHICSCPCVRDVVGYKSHARFLAPWDLDIKWAIQDMFTY